jgi:hypothetical protein
VDDVSRALVVGRRRRDVRVARRRGAEGRRTRAFDDDERDVRDDEGDDDDARGAVDARGDVRRARVRTARERTKERGARASVDARG